MKIYNFSSAPSILPAEVYERAAKEAMNYKGKGVPVTELSRSCAEYEEIIDSACASLRRLLSLPKGYTVLFVAGGAIDQLPAIAQNLMSEHKVADYVITGQRSKAAEQEAKKYGDIAIAAVSAGASPPYSTIPELKRSSFRPDADYVHINYNSTIYGTKFPQIPETGNIPLVADMSAVLLTEPFDMSKFAFVYCDCEQNISPSGMTLIIMREEFLTNSKDKAPTTFSYKKLAERAANIQTAPIFNIYMANLTFEWLESIGGIDEIKRRNERKASLIYDYIDSQSYFTAPVDKKCRSMMNVVFTSNDSSMDKKFIKAAAKEGLINLGGHPFVGGMCASIYNAMPYEGVERLVSFMRKFAQENPKIDA